MSRKKLAWANKEVETFVCILGEEDVVYDVYVAAAAIDIRPTTKGTVGSGNATSELSWANRSLPTAPLRSDPFRTLQWKCGIMLATKPGFPKKAWLCEVGNFSIHLTLNSLKGEGTKVRNFPTPTRNPFTWLFFFVSCPNYTYEVGAWLGFSIMTQCLPAPRQGPPLHQGTSGLVHTAELHPDERLGQGEAQSVYPGVQSLPGPTYGHRPPGALTACGAPGHCCTLGEVSMALRMSPPLEYTD
ncbi:unnamed protein product [Boreogadus saida]